MSMPFVKFYETNADLTGPEDGVMRRKIADQKLATGEFRWVRSGVIQRARADWVIVGQTRRLPDRPGMPGWQCR
jgi:hypothetical protein